MTEKAVRILGVYAHPDDETFCAGGTLAKYTASGAVAMVLSVTRGEAGQIRDAHIATRRTLGDVRQQELLKACKHLGVEQVVCLDYGDGKLDYTDIQDLVGEVVRVIRSFRPDIVLTFGNDGGYGHPDHIAIGEATDAAFKLAGDANQYPEQIASGLSPHQPGWLYHSAFPRNQRLLLHSLVRWLKSLDSRFRGSMDFVRTLRYFADEATVLGYSNDNIQVEWYPPGFSIIEQNEPAQSLYLVLSGNVDVFQEQSDGNMEKVNEIGEGNFFGEEGIANGELRNAYCVARDSVSCLVFSMGKPTAFAGRGQGAQFLTTSETFDAGVVATTCIDVSAFVPNKIAAMMEYRTQFPDLAAFPSAILEELLHYEYFMRTFPKPDMEYALAISSK